MDAWGALRLTVPSALADELCGLLAWKHLGAEMDGSPTTAGQQRLSVYLREPDAQDEAVADARRILSEFGLDPEECALHFEPVADGRWVERYQEQLRPFTIGTRYRIFPSGEIEEKTDDLMPIRLVPGRAFGTGEHATTQLCTERLETLVNKGDRWLDVGCGTAILSIVARELGAGSVLAVDVDPQAIEVAREVLAANHVEDGIELLVGEIQLAGREAFDGVVVNISAPFFDGAGPALAGVLRPAGTLIASGFTIEQHSAVASALTSAGFEVDDRPHHRDVWAALVARRRS